MSPLEWILSGGLAAALAAGGKFWSDLRETRRADKTAETSRYDDLWTKLQAISEKSDREGDECRQRLAESERLRREDQTRMEEQRSRDRALWQDEFDKMSDKYRNVLRICADQEEEIQHSRIVIAKINQRRDQPVPPPAPAPLIGGKRSYDVPVPGTATVTVTVPAPAASGSPSELIPPQG